MKSIRGRATSLVLILTTAILSASGGDESEPGDSAANRNLAAKVSISAGDYGFEAPETIPGGLVEISFRNGGKEPHFAGLARALPGRTFEEVRDALSAPAPPDPSSGPALAPPPLEDVAGMPTTDPERNAKLTVSLVPGTSLTVASRFHTYSTGTSRYSKRPNRCSHASQVVVAGAEHDTTVESGECAARRARRSPPATIAEACCAGSVTQDFVKNAARDTDPWSTFIDRIDSRRSSVRIGGPLMNAGLNRPRLVENERVDAATK